MARITKYRQGEGFESLQALVSWLETGGWVYLYGTPKHPRVMENMTLFTLRTGLPWMKKALRNEGLP